MNINLHIERLVLDGLPIEPEDRRRLQAAIEAQLMSMLTVQGLPRAALAHLNVASVAAPWLRFDKPVDAKALGAGIGEAIYNGLAQGI